jgi:hypothetical protein
MFMPALENLCGWVRKWWFGDGLEAGWLCILPDDPLAETFAVWDCFVPEELDWPAEEDGADDGPAGPGEDESHEAEA